MSDVKLIDLCSALKSLESRSRLRRLIDAGSVTVNGEKVLDAHKLITIRQLPLKVKIGKRDYFEVT